MSTRPPRWTRDELILALDLYMRLRGRFPSRATASSEILELSNLLRAMYQQGGWQVTPTFRNANSIYMKLMNFRRLDPLDAAQGLERGSDLEEEVWKLYADDPNKLKKIARSIRKAVERGIGLPSDVPDRASIDEAVEGRILTILHFQRERNRRIVEEKKRQALERHGRLFCDACFFDFYERYGERGFGFIECHHIRPLWESEPDRTTRLDDLALLCANCHRMIHWKRPWLSMNDLFKCLGRNGE